MIFEALSLSLFLHFLWMYSISWIKCLGAYLKILTERGGVPHGQESSWSRRVLIVLLCWFCCSWSLKKLEINWQWKQVFHLSQPTIKKVREIGGWLFNGGSCLTLKWALIWERVLIRAWELNTLTPKISLVILLTVCHAILMMSIQRIWYWINS